MVRLTHLVETGRERYHIPENDPQPLTDFSGIFGGHYVVIQSKLYMYLHKLFTIIALYVV